MLVILYIYIYDKDSQKWVLPAQKDIGHEDIRFKASKHWICNFKKAHRIISRKINKFVNKKTFQEAEYLQSAANKFVIKVKQTFQEKGLESVFTSDQSQFQLGMHSGRTLTVEAQQ